MFRASIRWSLAVLFLASYVPVPVAPAPPGAGAGPANAACCAPRACCTADHACTTGGGCASESHGVALAPGSSQAGAPCPVFRAASCHPEAARIGSAPTLDPGGLAAYGSPAGDELWEGAGTPAATAPSSRPTSPQVPPPRV